MFAYFIEALRCLSGYCKIRRGVGKRKDLTPPSRHLRRAKLLILSSFAHPGDWGEDANPDRNHAVGQITTGH